LIKHNRRSRIILYGSATAMTGIVILDADSIARGSPMWIGSPRFY
jgi:hypothetical protein